MANHKVGQTIIAKIGGIPTEAKICAILESKNELIVDFGHEQTATIHERDIVKEPKRIASDWASKFDRESQLSVMSVVNQSRLMLE